MPVRYVDSRYDFTELMTQFAEGGATAMTQWVPFLASIHKSEQWAEEREWRIVKAGDDERPGEVFPARGTVAVYLGTRMRRDHRARIASLAAAQHWTVYEVRMSDDGFKMEFTAIDSGAT